MEDKNLARQLVELGYRGTGEPLSREGFEFHKAKAYADGRGDADGNNVMSILPRKGGMGIPTTLKVPTPFQKLLQELTPLNQQGNHATIIYIRTFS